MIWRNEDDLQNCTVFYHQNLYCLFIRQYLCNSLKTIEFIFFLATEECKCSCNDVILTAIIGVLGFIIILLIIYIVWLHKKGEFHYSIFVPIVWSDNARESLCI